MGEKRKIFADTKKYLKYTQGTKGGTNKKKDGHFNMNIVVKKQTKT